MTAMAAGLLGVSAAAAQERPSPSVAPPEMQRWAPGLAEYTDDVLFGDVWRRTDLSPRDRSLVTLSTLVATGRTEQLRGHLGRALDNGVTPREISGIVTHLAFYGGWPSAVSALSVVDGVFSERGIKPAAIGSAGDPQGRSTRSGAGAVASVVVFPGGSAAAAAPATRFTGRVVTDTPFGRNGTSRVGGARVTFTPGARTNWHRHPLGQLLVVTEGQGLVQDAGGPVRAIREGDVVWTAPGVKHWHGAAPERSMSHVAIVEQGPSSAVEWMEPVNDAQYRTRPRKGP